MPLESRFQADIPECSVQQWIFQSCFGPLSNKKAWIDAENPHDNFLTFSGLRLLAKRIALGLLRNGLQTGDRVLVFANNSIVYPAFVMGIWMAGGIFTGANPAATERELAYQLQDSEPAVVFAMEPRLDTALKAIHMSGIDKTQVFFICSPDALPPKASVDELGQRISSHGCRHWWSLLASERDGHDFQWIEPSDPKNAVCSLNYSSGTTGLPKGAEITHYNYVGNGTGNMTLAALGDDYEHSTQGARTLCFLPMYHALCQGYFMTTMVKEQSQTYVMPSFNFIRMLQHIEALRITKLFAVPPILIAMSKHPQVRRYDLDSLEAIACGGSSLASDTQNELRARFPNVGLKLRQGWGMTELTCTALAWDPRRLTSSGVGELAPNCRARIVDVETGHEITQPNMPGELLIASPSRMRGYWRNEEASRLAIATDSDGTRWLRTGDIVYVEEYAPGAFFHVVDRLKELIKVKANQVAPAELEALLLEHPGVADVGVVPFSIGTEEVPRAYVVRVDSYIVNETDIAEWVASRVAPFKRLRGGVVFTDVIPRNPSGKILRRVLRERAKQDVQLRARL